MIRLILLRYNCKYLLLEWSESKITNFLERNLQFLKFIFVLALLSNFGLEGEHLSPARDEFATQIFKDFLAADLKDIVIKIFYSIIIIYYCHLERFPESA